MTRPPSLASAMTPFPHAIELNASLRQAREMMTAHNVRHLPVTDRRALAGVISHSDVMAVQAREAEDRSLDALTVKDAYVADAFIVDLSEPIENVLLTMAARRIGSAVVTRRGRLAGVFTRVDACRCFGEYLRENFPRPGGDEAA
jgi:acetoin utilization protein AcuB